MKRKKTCISKKIESLAHKTTMCFKDRFNLLNSNHFGFLAGQNTSDALTEFLDKAYDAINQNRVLLTVFLDFFNAFDTVDHYYDGFRVISLDWFLFL